MYFPRTESYFRIELFNSSNGDGDEVALVTQTAQSWGLNGRICYQHKTKFIPYNVAIGMVDLPFLFEEGRHDDFSAIGAWGGIVQPAHEIALRCWDCSQAT